MQVPGTLSTDFPTVLTSFIGRQRELAEATQRLVLTRLLTLTGAAGCGKTRLTLHLAEAAKSRYQDGVCWVELARLADTALVPQAVARRLHVAEQSGRPLVEGLVSALHSRQLLLVLDNCEHLRPACAQLSESLLARTGVTILATSREPLGVVGEALYPVPALSLPPRASPVTDGAEVAQFEAIQLFVARTRALLPDFELTRDNVAAVIHICRQLNGVPLALELVCARLNVLTPQQIAARLDTLLDWLPPIYHVAYSHHRSLRAAIDWSYDLLSKEEQILLRRLSAFAGGCSLSSAEIVCSGEGVERAEVLALLSALVSKSLVAADTFRTGEARYTLLETIRQYAQEKLAAAGEQPALRHRHLQYIVQLAEDAMPRLRSQEQQEWLNALEEEYDNIRAALSWSLASGHIEPGLRIAVAIYQFWTIRDYVEEGLAWLQRLLAQTNAETALPVHAQALTYANNLAGFRGNREAQQRYGAEAAALAATLGEDQPSARAWALTAQAYSARAESDYETELRLNRQAIELFRASGESYYLGVILSTSSFTAMSLGQYELARTLLEEAFPILREVGDPYRIAMMLNFSGDLARCQQNYPQAQMEYEESIALLRQLDAVRDLASALHNLGHTCLHLGDAERAHALFNESMAAQLAQANALGAAECLLGFAALAIGGDLPVAGARLLAAAVAIGGERVATAWAATRMEYEHYLARARAHLSESAFQVEQARGRALSLQQAVAYAQDVGQKVLAAQQTRARLDALTPREREVAALIAQGKTNGEIAADLVISKRTVEKHIANILAKLWFTHRAQIVRWGIETGLAKSHGPESASE